MERDESGKPDGSQLDFLIQVGILCYEKRFLITIHFYNYGTFVMAKVHNMFVVDERDIENGKHPDIQIVSVRLESKMMKRY